MNGIGHIISKELTRVFKDKKLIFSLFILPVVLVIGIFSLISSLSKSVSEDIEAHTPIAYVMNAPESFDALMTSADLSCIVIDNEAKLKDAKDKLLTKEADIVVVFPAGFEAAVLTGMDSLNSVVVPEIEVAYNPSEDYSNQAMGVYSIMLDSYKQMLLANRFGNLDAVTMFSLKETYIQDESKAVGKALGQMLPYFITMLIFASAMGLGTDMFAGEKERGTLQSLLLTPLNRSSIVIGKIISLALISVLSSAVYMISMLVAMPIMSGGAASELSISFSASQITMLLILTLGVVLLYVSIIGLVSVLAKNLKEASAYISPVYMLVVVAGMITMFTSANGVFVKYIIPVYGSSMAFKDILTQEITVPNFAGAAVSTYLVAGILTFAMTKAFGSEKVMFNA